MLIGSSFYENLKMAFATLRNNKLRSFLTIFGVIIGVITVMLISSIISGIDMAVKKQVESFGTRSIFLRKFDIKAVSTGRRTQEERMRKPLTLEDAEALKQLPSIEVAVPFLDITNNWFGQKLLVSGKNGKTSSSVRLQGTLPDVERTNTVILQEGRWFSQNESDDRLVGGGKLFSVRLAARRNSGHRRQSFPRHRRAGKTRAAFRRRFGQQRSK
jgi:putative ABC transport system permease protein